MRVGGTGRFNCSCIQCIFPFFGALYRLMTDTISTCITDN